MIAASATPGRVVSARRPAAACSGVKLRRSRICTGAVAWLIPRVKSGMGTKQVVGENFRAIDPAKQAVGTPIRRPAAESDIVEASQVTFPVHDALPHVSAVFPGPRLQPAGAGRRVGRTRASD